MQNKFIIVITRGKEKEVWGQITDVCSEHGFSLNYLKSRKFPFKYKGALFEKIPYKKPRIDWSKKIKKDPIQTPRPAIISREDKIASPGFKKPWDLK